MLNDAMSDPNGPLRKAYEQWKLGKFPRVGDVNVEGANVDLAHDDGHVAGLCGRWLENGSIDPHLVIQLNDTIEPRLQRAEKRLPQAKAEIDSLRAYHARVIRLAETLSTAAGVPIVWSRG